MTIEEKAAEKIWVIATETEPSNMTDNDKKLYLLYASDILSIFSIEVDCPECGGEGDICSGEVWDTVMCDNCNGTGKITKIPESGDVGRVV